MEVTFRRAEAADADLIVSMMRELNAHEGIAFSEGDARRALAEIVADDRLGRVWVIEDGRGAVGYLVLTLGFSFEFRGRDAFVDELFVRAEARGRGVGARAVRFAEEACRRLGVRALHLEVERENAAAQRVYRRAGFKDHDRYLLTKWIEEETTDGERGS